MRELIFGHDAEIAAWVADRIDHVTDFGPCAAIGVAINGTVIAGTVFHDYQPQCELVQASMAAESPMFARKDLIGGILAYPFEQLGVWMCFTATPHKQDKIIKFNNKIGFSKKTIVPHAFGPKKHATICQMLRPEYLSLYGDLHGKIEPIPAAAS